MKRIVTWVEFTYHCDDDEVPVGELGAPDPAANEILSAIDAYLDPRPGDVFTVLSHTELDWPAEQEHTS